MTDCQLCYMGEDERQAWSHRQIQAGEQIDGFLDRCIAFIRGAFRKVHPRHDNDCCARTDDIFNVLTHRDFNYQSKGRIAHLADDVRARIDRRARDGRPLKLMLLYNGGYRASPDVLHDLIFTPDATELLLLFQIARLKVALARVYPAGFLFDIVINNDVATHTNDIPTVATERYARSLRDMVRTVGADRTVTVLLQSELGTGGNVVPPAVGAPIDDATHRIVERFLGRACSPAEAQHRSAIYVAAERAWATDLARIDDSHCGIIMRQVAHPACLSFRPFPGGAIRVQNGSIGFRLRDDARDPVPFLVTSNTGRGEDLLTVPVRAMDRLYAAPRMNSAA